VGVVRVGRVVAALDPIGAMTAFNNRALASIAAEAATKLRMAIAGL
jgi:hypothetical protein